MPGGSRRIEVPAQRLVRWVEGFTERHSGVVWTPHPEGFSLSAADGVRAVVQLPCPPWNGTTTAAAVEHCLADRWYAVLIVRRGGFLIANVATRQHVTLVDTHKLGRRHVQGRTAAGGWSQQRFARRRAKQTDELLDAVVSWAVELLVAPLTQARRVPATAWLATGGDRALIRAVLSDKKLLPLAQLPLARHLSVPDPGRDLLAGLPDLCTGAVITVTEHPPTQGPVSGS